MNFDRFFTIIDIISYFISSIALVLGLIKLKQYITNKKKFTWNDVDKLTKRIIKKIDEDNYHPDVIITIGRGGAIIGAILSGNLPKAKEQKINIPIVGTERKYTWENNVRKSIDIKLNNYLSLENKKILLVAGDIMTGETMKTLIEDLNSHKIKQINTACLLKGVNSILTPDYFGKEIDSRFEVPWMYKEYNYSKDSRESVSK